MNDVYRIGEFAEKLGVTPDWLKYYEKRGIIKPIIKENGYRYYGFVQASYVYSCLELKNMGFNTEEIVHMIKEGTFSELMDTMGKKRENICEQIAFEKAILEKYDLWHKIMGRFDTPYNWNIRMADGFYFLPFSNRNTFIADEEVAKRNREWNRRMPVVDMTQRIFIPEDYDQVPRTGPAKNQWGLSVSREFAERLHLHVDEPAEYIPPFRCMEVYCRADMDKDSRENVVWPGTTGNNPLPDVLPILEKHNFRIVGNCYNHRIAKLNEGGHRITYNILYVPIE